MSSDALPFSSSISKGTCPSMPHEAIAAGWRKLNNYQGVWQVENCELKWFLPDEACDLIGSIGKISFKGDSLIRQLACGLGVVLSGNYRTGGLPRGTPLKYLESCQCERQWQCWEHPGGHRFADGMHKSPQFDLCPKWTRDHILTSPFDDGPAPYKSEKHWRVASAHGPVIVITNGAAMHSVGNFDAPRKKMEDLLKQARMTNGTLMPMTLHYPGVNKVQKYKDSQGPSQIEEMNSKMLDWTKANNLWPLRLFEYTKGLWSNDGIHYNDENIVFVQLLLNSLWRMQREYGLLAIVNEYQPEDPTTFKIGNLNEVGVKLLNGHPPGEVPRPYQSLP